VVKLMVENKEICHMAAQSAIAPLVLCLYLVQKCTSIYESDMVACI
jgi:hypothetical protein